MDTSFTNTLENIAQAGRYDDVDWGSLTNAERARWLEVEGFLVMPGLISPGVLTTVREELDQLELIPRDYSEFTRGNAEGPWLECPETSKLMALPEVTGFLEDLFGDELICNSCGYDVSLPGHPGIAIHTDAQPYGSEIFGVQASSPVLIRVLFYLDDLTPERAPFKVIPKSHLSLHRDGNPYNRYLAHDGERMVNCPAGSAVLINQKVFHGNYPNHSDSQRRLLAYAYRPTWAGPIGEIEEWDSDKVAAMPPEVQSLMGSLNTRNIDFDVPNRPEGMATTADGIHPDRWEN